MSKLKVAKELDLVSLKDEMLKDAGLKNIIENRAKKLKIEGDMSKLPSSVVERLLSNATTEIEKYRTKENVRLSSELLDAWKQAKRYLGKKQFSQENRKPQEISSSLIPIKGISKRMIEELSDCRIFDIVSLLTRCKTNQQRVNVAAKLGISVDYVNTWVKQADLWRIDGMTTDLAYLLAQAGVRSIQDLARLSAEKTYAILKGLQKTQPDFILCTLSDLEEVIKNAGDAVKLLAKKDSLDDCNPYGFEDDAPKHIYKDELDDETTSSAQSLYLVEDLIELDCVLPLPRLVSGKVILEKDSEENSEKPCSGLKVEIEGVVSPAEDKTEAAENPSCITDSTGKFIITLPERYSFKETVKIIISNSHGRQEFIKNSTELINSMIESNMVDLVQEFLSKWKEGYLALNTGNLNEDEKKDKIAEFIKSLRDVVNDKDQDLEAFYTGTSFPARKICLALKALAYDADNGKLFRKGIQDIFEYILKNATLEARLEGVNSSNADDGFVVVKEVFEEKGEKVARALPSVKLMGDDENPVMLSSDTAPSRMFSYSMLQRLIEPELSTGTRKSVTEPVDVDKFRTQMYSDHEKLSQMSSLGLGYQLNMHQAWVPDGFALGDLLYSLILAPGEEQRLVVRENTQSYDITDTAEGLDSVDESYQNSQTDDTSAAYEYGVQQMMEAGSSYKAQSSSWGVGGSATGGYGGFFGLGISGSYSKTKSSGSSKAHQNNSQNEASSAAQRFQQCIKTASNRISQAKRVSVSSATSTQSDSVATKIVANHNHSHAMTIQYWEVMRRYRLETAVDSVDLVLFVPMKLIKFLGNEKSLIFPEEDMASFDKARFNKRYSVLLKYATTLERALPYKYRSGLRLIQSYAACPKWTFEAAETGSKNVVLSFNSNVLSFDDLTATITLKNGKGSVAGEVDYVRTELRSTYKTSEALKDAIRRHRNTSGNVSVTCTFTLPQNISEEDISSIRIGHSCEGLRYTLYKDLIGLSPAEREAWDNYVDKQMDFAQDDRSSSKDLRRMAHYMEALPEAFRTPEVYLSASNLNSLGRPSIRDVDLKLDGKPLQTALSSSKISWNTRVSVYSDAKTLKRSEFQKMEETLHHVVTSTLKYSQAIWGALSSDERAMMLDEYTVQMNFRKLEVKTGDEKGQGTGIGNGAGIPLLNCVNVRKLLGFYGNCMLLPFTFPEELAEQLGRTAADIQDQLYRFHTNSFRAPTTVISLPTKGMIGEAVLGQTNVSEVIDLTRFWNWQDSPIDKMEIDSSYLNGNDYLANKSTKDISALNLQGVTPTTPVTAADLVSALVNKQTPQFENITGLDQLKDVVNGVTTASATGRDNIINKTSEMATAALTAGLEQKKAEIAAQKEIELEKLKNGSSNSSGGNSAGGSGSNNSGNGGGAGSSGGSGTSGSAGNGSAGGSGLNNSSNGGGTGAGGNLGVSDSAGNVSDSNDGSVSGTSNGNSDSGASANNDGNIDNDSSLNDCEEYEEGPLCGDLIYDFEMGSAVEDVDDKDVSVKSDSSILSIIQQVCDMVSKNPDSSMDDVVASFC